MAAVHRPYVPMGVTQQERVAPTKLVQAHLDRRQEERDTAHLSLPELLLLKGCMTGPHRRTHPMLRFAYAARAWIVTAPQAIRRAIRRKPTPRTE